MTKKKKSVEFSDMSGWQKTIHVMGYIGVVGIGLNIVVIAMGGAVIGSGMLNAKNKTPNNLKGRI